jgi:arylsulfatase A-like enzyme
MWIYSPRHVAAREIDSLVSQIDIAPTLLGMLNVDYLSMAFRDQRAARGASDRALIAASSTSATTMVAT